MRFVPTALPGVVEVLLDPIVDERGSFARAYCEDEFAAAGLPLMGVQCNLSVNRWRGTLRGLHYQAAPAAETKLVRCVRGRMFDVAVDLRPDSPTFCRWIGVELDARHGNALFIPEGFAHGFITLADDTSVFYLMGARFSPGHGRGVRWDDPAFGIAWPEMPQHMSERDAAYPDFQP